MDPRDSLVVKLDVPSRDDALRLLDRMGDGVSWVKVGLELFSAEGPVALKDLKARGYRVFFDAKYHDIPTTVKRALVAIGDIGVDLVNVHALGGAEMVEAAAGALRGSPTRLLAVTILTSHDDTSLDSIGVGGGTTAAALRLASLAHRAGADGVVAAGDEIRAIRDAEGDDFLILVPGVRGKGEASQDQKRTVTVDEALMRGATHVVLGRTLFRAQDLSARFAELAAEAAAGLGMRTSQVG